MPERDDLWADIRTDEDAERALADLGPLVQRKEQAEAEGMDPTFKRDLRARLVAAAAEPDRAARSPGSVVRRRLNRQQWSAMALVVTALAAVLVAVVILHGRGTGNKPVAVGPTKSLPALHPPPPAVADLLRSAAPGAGGAGGGGLLMPEITLFDTQASVYPGHLTLSASHLPSEPRSLPAYLLAGPSFDLPRITQLARRLGVIGTPQPGTSPLDNSAWIVVKEGGPPSPRPLHSLAIARHTGELIYHNPPSTPATSPAALALNRTRAVSLARSWVAALGWPASLPVQGAAPDTQILPPSAGIPWKVSFGWPGTIAAAQSEVTVIILPSGQVIEARLWPPSRREGAVQTRDVQSAWAEVQRGAVPVVVEGMGGRSSGSGTVQHMDIIQALDTAGKTPYLVPMYRFSGTVHLSGLGAYPWSALVPAMAAKP